MADFNTDAYTNRAEGQLRQSRLVSTSSVNSIDEHTFLSTGTELDTIGNHIFFECVIPSNAILKDFYRKNEALDDAADLIVDLGVAARDIYVETISGVDTRRFPGEVISEDLFGSGLNGFQSEDVDWFAINLNYGVVDTLKPIWELLGYDVDPITKFNVVMTVTTVTSGLSTDGCAILRPEFFVD